MRKDYGRGRDMYEERGKKIEIYKGRERKEGMNAQRL